MSRLVPSAIALLAAMSAAPVFAADWGGFDENDMRGAYVNEPKDWAGLNDEYDPMNFEFGLRYWYSWGAQSASADGNATTVSATDQSHILEGHLRIEDESSHVYAKAWGGYAMVINGTFADPFGGGGIADGTIGYLGADIGWNALGDTDMGVGPLLGYQYWRDAPDTGRYNYTTATSAADIAYDPVTGQTFLPGDSAPNALDAHMLRLGIQGKANFDNFIDFSAELAAVPYAKVNGTIGVDDPTFDGSVYGGPAQAPYGGMGAVGNISSIRSSPTEIDGWGYGGMAEAWVGVHPMENMVFRLGGRAWYIQGTADATYSRATIGNPSDGDLINPPNFDTDPSFSNASFISTNNFFSMMRYGLMAELTYAF